MHLFFLLFFKSKSFKHVFFQQFVCNFMLNIDELLSDFRDDFQKMDKTHGGVTQLQSFSLSLRKLPEISETE